MSQETQPHVMCPQEHHDACECPAKPPRDLDEVRQMADQVFAGTATEETNENVR